MIEQKALDLIQNKGADACDNLSKIIDNQLTYIGEITTVLDKLYEANE